MYQYAFGNIHLKNKISISGYAGKSPGGENSGGEKSGWEKPWRGKFRRGKILVPD